VEEIDPVAVALAEDIGTGDLTSRFFVPENQRSRARIFAKEPAVVAGTHAVQRVFHLLDPAIQVRIAQPDGAEVAPHDLVLNIIGDTRAILTGERVALNFLQRLSGIATLTRRFVKKVRGTSVEILDTRKTTPGLRQFEKAAVKAGGGTNHRMGLYDGVMVKDNHLLARPSLEKGIRGLRAEYPNILLEIEADSVEQVRDFVTLSGVDVILLDNMSPAELRQCVALRRPGVKFEASGGITLDTVRAIAETGVDYISIGQLTHSARAIDFSLELVQDSD
jgi:nicotinate-nucleotide pyrophosphorylase (carboxylating)